MQVASETQPCYLNSSLSINPALNTDWGRVHAAHCVCYKTSLTESGPRLKLHISLVLVCIKYITGVKAAEEALLLSPCWLHAHIESKQRNGGFLKKKTFYLTQNKAYLPACTLAHSDSLIVLHNSGPEGTLFDQRCWHPSLPHPSILSDSGFSLQKQRQFWPSALLHLLHATLSFWLFFLLSSFLSFPLFPSVYEYQSDLMSPAFTSRVTADWITAPSIWFIILWSMGYL